MDFSPTPIQESLNEGLYLLIVEVLPHRTSLLPFIDRSRFQGARAKNGIVVSYFRDLVDILPKSSFSDFPGSARYAVDQYFGFINLNPC